MSVPRAETWQDSLFGGPLTPLVPLDLLEISGMTQDTGSAGKPGSRDAQRTVLLVDDDVDIVRGTQLRLKAKGYHVLVANDGRSCVAIATEQQPDVILMDVRMPGQDGLETLAQLQSSDVTRDIPVVMLSGSVTDEPLALDSGARFFLRKPVAADSLLAAVRNVTESCVASAS